MSVVLREHERTQPEQQRVLVQPGHFPARQGRQFGELLDHRDVDRVVPLLLSSRILAIDFETSGGFDYSLPEQREIIGVGFAYDTGNCYFDWRSLEEHKQNQLLDVVYAHQGLIAHNVYFDGGILYSNFDAHPKWLACTSAMYKQLSNEGWAGQVHGLKSAMVDILGWEDSNEHELDEWLVVNKHYIGNRRVDESYEALLNGYRLGLIKPEKSKMGLAPPEILGKYCALDSEATYLLYTQVFEPLLEQFPDYRYYHEVEFLHLIRIHIEQKMHGILMDREGLLERRAFLEAEIARYSEQFRTHSRVCKHIQIMERELIKELVAREPAKYLKQKERKEPAQFVKSGAVSKNWLKWKELSKLPRVVSKNWINWNDKLEAALRGFDPDYKFNLNSGDQLRVLFFDRLGYEPREFTEGGEESPPVPKVGVASLKHFGEEGKLLVERSYLVKELSYISDYIERTENRATIHPDFKMPGTSTGRLSGASPNIQQLPKTTDVMSLFVARPGHVWVDIDFKALESVVAAELSGDENMHILFGDGAPENDMHLFLAAHIPAWREKIAATGYTPRNPPPGSVSRAKKECKPLRSIAKTAVYAFQFGAGAQKVYDGFIAEGVSITFDDVEALHKTYWKLFSGLKRYAQDLQQEWSENNGFIINGIGRPMCCTEEYKKDLLNRKVQSTGHDILVKYVYILTNKLNEISIPWRPIIIDLHDATTVEVPEKYAGEVAAIMKDAMTDLNCEMGGEITLSGVPVIGTNMAEVKECES
jgi:DNA polymerase I-like protein with 3'-5' exonuclease and polymerase domains